MLRVRTVVGTVVGALLLAVAGPAAGAGGAGGAKRTESAEYIAPMTTVKPPVGSGVSTCNFGLHMGCVIFEPAPGEAAVSVVITDATGLDVYGYVYQDRTGDGISDTGAQGPICGQTPRPVPISSKYPVMVFVHVGQSSTLWCNAAGTRGTMTATFIKGTPLKSGRSAERPPG